MKADVLTLAALVFIVGLLMSGLGLTKVFESEPDVPAALQQGIATQEIEK